MTRIKICGLRELKNTAQVAGLNVDFMGLIFAPSPRQVSLERACVLSELIHSHEKQAVGVFVDESDEFIAQAAKSANLNVVQIYKSVSKGLFEALKARGVGVWQVVSIGAFFCLPPQIHADMVLFDTKGAAKGGNGTAFKWHLLREYKNDFAIAGGLGADNAVAASCATNALGQKPSVLDFNSRIEKAVGVKDINLIKEILKKLGR